jgi:hypothetical protein
MGEKELRYKLKHRKLITAEKFSNFEKDVDSQA